MAAAGPPLSSSVPWGKFIGLLRLKFIMCKHLPHNGIRSQMIMIIKVLGTVPAHTCEPFCAPGVGKPALLHRKKSVPYDIHQRSPTPGQWTGTGPRPVRSQAAQQEGSGR